MANLNRVVISGNLVRDAQLRTTTNGTAVTSFTIAVNEKRRDGSKDVSYIDCVMFSDSLTQYLAKGRKVGATGRLRQSRWESDGQKRSRVEVIVDGVEFFDNGSREASSTETGSTVELYDEDIPF